MTRRKKNEPTPLISVQFAFFEGETDPRIQVSFNGDLDAMDLATVAFEIQTGQFHTEVYDAFKDQFDQEKAEEFVEALKILVEDHSAIIQEIIDTAETSDDSPYMMNSFDGFHNCLHPFSSTLEEE